jgi:hypothetical protein
MSERPRQSWWTIAAVTVLLLPVLYVASFGPACWLVKHGFIDLRTIVQVYGGAVRSDLHAFMLGYGEACSDGHTRWQITLALYDPEWEYPNNEFRKKPLPSD